MLTARMDLMKIQQFVTSEHVTQKLSLVARMAVAYPNYGCAILIMIVEMILMNPLTCAVKEIARLDGEDVLANLTTDVFQNGYSVMERMIVETIVMNFRRIAQHAKLTLTSSVRITAVFQNNGLGEYKHFYF